MEQRIASLEVAVSKLKLLLLKALPTEESSALVDDVSTDEGALADLYSLGSYRSMITEWRDVQAELVRFRMLFEFLQSVFPKHVSEAMSTVSKTADVRPGLGEVACLSMEKSISHLDLERVCSELKEDLRCELDRLREAMVGGHCDLVDLGLDRPAYVPVSKISCKIGMEAAQSEAVACMVPPGADTEDNSRGKYDKRRAIIENIKVKPIYMHYIGVRERGELLPFDVPGTPDPEDTLISKRTWESLVSKWRAALRQVYELRNELVGSEDDCVVQVEC